MSKSFFEENGGTYTKVGDYYLPDLALPDDGLGEEAYIGIWGQRRLDYLKKHKRVLYSQLLMALAHLERICMRLIPQPLSGGNSSSSR